MILQKSGFFDWGFEIYFPKIIIQFFDNILKKPWQASQKKIGEACSGLSRTWHTILELSFLIHQRWQYKKSSQLAKTQPYNEVTHFKKNGLFEWP